MKKEDISVGMAVVADGLRSIVHTINSDGTVLVTVGGAPSSQHYHPHQLEPHASEIAGKETEETPTSKKKRKK